MAFDHSRSRWLGISDLIAEPGGPTSISSTVARSRLDRLRFVTQDPIRAVLDGLAGDIVGHLLIAIGACVAILSQQHMRASWRIGAANGETGAMVTGGPFAISRNPVFVGQVILFVGLFLVFPSAVQLALTTALLIAIALQVRIEERVLAATLGESYLAYSRAVNRWIGGPRGGPTG